MGLDRRAWRRIKTYLFYLVCLGSTLISLLVLVLLIGQLIIQGLPSLSWKFITSFPSRFPENAGILAALFGSLWLIALTAVFCIPIGIGAAIYLEEYSTDNWLTSFIKTNIANLAGVPAIIYGILGLALFVRTLALGRSVLAGALTMALLVMPVVIVSAQEAIRAVPRSLREASYVLGATRWQTTIRAVLPASISSIATGVILALSRAIGEAAPLIMIGALTFVAFVPDGPLSAFTVLPIQIFNWAARPQAGFHQNAAAAILVLLTILFIMNSIVAYIRYRFHQKL